MDSERFKNILNWWSHSKKSESLPSGDRSNQGKLFSQMMVNFGNQESETKTPAIELPNFKPHGYQVLEKLGHNYAGGRFTYLGVYCKTKQPVAIKQFQFAKPGADWSAYKAHEREIKVLRELSHPGIPRYLDSFETEEGFCLVHEYKNAKSLAISRRLTPQKIKKIATSLLEILVYLQNRVPPVIHRDIKPENILVDDRLTVYLVDFGLARMAGDELMQSSTIAGTPGFMPPEQLLDRDLSEASDLYGLGVTLIALLTRTKSAEITKLIDHSYRVNFREQVPFLSEAFIEWLEKMVQPNMSDRFAHAAAALEALTPLSVDRTLPEPVLSQSAIELTGEYGDILTQTIEIKNAVADTVLQGYWEIVAAGNSSETLPKSAEWLKIKPKRFKRNRVECQMIADSQNLLIDQVYERNLLLHTNSATPTKMIVVTVKVSQPKITLAKTSAILQERLSSRLPFALFLLSAATPLTLISPYIAGGISIPLMVFIANDLSTKLDDDDVNKIAEVSQTWVFVPSLAGLGLFLMTHLEIDWVESPTSQLVLRLLIVLLMSGVGVGLFALYKSAFKRIAVLLPLVIFASSFVLVGVTGGLVGKLAEAGVGTYILTGTVKQKIEQQKLSNGLVLRIYGIRAMLGLGLGSAIAGCLIYFGIA